MAGIGKVLVLGAGVMGHGFAQYFAMRGHPVRLADRNREQLERALEWIDGSLRFFADEGELAPEELAGVLGRIEPVEDWSPAADQIDFVLEAVSENIAVKKAVFGELDSVMRPEVILASNTSSYDINEFTPVVKHPERVIGTHWFHPPQITPCVEIIPSDATSPRTVERTMEFMRGIGKYPTLCRSAPGFVANRIQFAMAAEAYAIIEEGLATPEQIDRIVKSSFGFRLGAYGPCEICDQAGVDTYTAIFEYLHEKLKKDQFKPPEILKNLLREGRCGLKTGSGFYSYEAGAADKVKRERDGRLFARLRLFAKEQGLGLPGKS